jgi:predicted O-methyltransferase YrrM
LAKGLSLNGKLITIDINDELKDFTQSFFDKANVKNKIDFIIGDALEIIPTLDLAFDLVFIDGEKSNYKKYFDIIIDKVRIGGFIIADNTLWDGKVIEKNIKTNDYFTKGIIEFNTYVKNCDRVEVALFPIRDGITVMRKIK